MKTRILILLCLTCLSFPGCKRKLDVYQFEGNVPLTYTTTSGTISILGEYGGFRFKLPTAKTVLEYSVRENGEVLEWEIKAKGEYLGIKNGKDIRRKNADNAIRLYPLEQSHRPISFTMKTDRLGNIVSMEKYVGEKGLDGKGDNYWVEYYKNVFSMVFVPFVTDKAQMNTVVSHGNIAIQPENVINFPTSEVALTGARKEKGRECLALQYENESNIYKNKLRQKCIDSVKVDFMIDKDTRIVQRASSVLHGKNWINFLTIESIYE